MNVESVEKEEAEKKQKEEQPKKRQKKKEKNEIYITIKDKTENEKKYDVFFGDEIPEKKGYDFVATYPFFADSLLWIFCDDEGLLKGLEWNAYVFDILLELNEYLTEKQRKEHVKWSSYLLRNPIVGPVLLKFKNAKFYENVKKHIETHCELAELHQ